MNHAASKMDDHSNLDVESALDLTVTKNEQPTQGNLTHLKLCSYGF